MDISIILPTYNEKENIIDLIPKLDHLIKKLNKKAEIIVVDDSSPDGTGDATLKLNQLYGNIRLITRPKKEGMGAAIKEGFDNARGHILLSLDVDSLDTLEIEKMLIKIEEGFDLVVGSRYLQKGSYKKGLVKTFIKNRVSSLGNKFAKIMLGINLTDFSLNCRAIKKNVWENINVTEKSNSFMLETIVKSHFKGYKIAEVPVTFNERKYGKSKLKLTLQSYLFLRKVFHYTFNYRF